MVLRDDRELLAHLAQVNSDVPDLALRLMNGQLPVREQRAFALRLVDIAEALMTHADRRDRPVIDHVPTAVQLATAGRSRRGPSLVEDFAGRPVYDGAAVLPR